MSDTAQVELKVNECEPLPIMLTPSATDSTFIMRGSFMYLLNASGFFCTSVSMAMKSGCARYPRVVGSVASLPYSRGLHSFPFQFNLSTLCGMGGALRGNLGGVRGYKGVCMLSFCIQERLRLS